MLAIFLNKQANTLNNDGDASKKGREGGSKGQGVQEDRKRRENMNPMNKGPAHKTNRRQSVVRC